MVEVGLERATHESHSLLRELLGRGLEPGLSGVYLQVVETAGEVEVVPSVLVHHQVAPRPARAVPVRGPRGVDARRRAPPPSVVEHGGLAHLLPRGDGRVEDRSHVRRGWDRETAHHLPVVRGLLVAPRDLQRLVKVPLRR